MSYVHATYLCARGHAWRRHNAKGMAPERLSLASEGRAMANPPADGFLAGPPHAWIAAPKYFNDRAGSIYAGTNGIQRNIMAKAVLGL
jgi:alkylation response protein AidB-like acyl-CoA dehydrogenase